MWCSFTRWDRNCSNWTSSQTLFSFLTGRHEAHALTLYTDNCTSPPRNTLTPQGRRWVGQKWGGQMLRVDGPQEASRWLVLRTAHHPDTGGHWPDRWECERRTEDLCTNPPLRFTSNTHNKEFHQIPATTSLRGKLCLHAVIVYLLHWDVS